MSPRPPLTTPTLIGPFYPYLSMRDLADNLNLISGGNARWDSTTMLRHLQRKDGVVFRLDPAPPHKGKGRDDTRTKSKVLKSRWVTTVELLVEHYPVLYNAISQHLSPAERERLASALGGPDDDGEE